MNIRFILAISSLSLFLGGCSIAGQVLGSNKSRPAPLKALKELTPSINVKKAWNVKTGSAVGEAAIHPLIDSSTVYIAGGTKASAWNKNTGKQRWSNSIGEVITAGVNGTSSANQTQVFIGTNNGNAIALDANTGKILWIERLSSEVLSVSPSQNGRIAFRTADGKLHGLSASTGELIWQQTQKSPALTISGASVPILLGPLVIAGFDNGKIAAYHLQNGKKVWEVAIAKPRGNNALDRIIDVDGKIMSLGTALFAASLNGQIKGIDLSKGKTAWSNPFSSTTGVSVSPTGLYSSDDRGNIWKINPQTGEPLWKMDDLQRYQPTLPTIAGSLLIIADKIGNIHWVNSSTGLFAGRLKGDPSGYLVEPEISGNSAYTLSKSGVLSKLTW